MDDIIQQPEIAIVINTPEAVELVRYDIIANFNS
jgi:hypothetical protein